MPPFLAGFLDGFQSTPPARGATNLLCLRKDYHHISIHAPREGGDIPELSPFKKLDISIHAPREGGDPAQFDYQAMMAISIHAPREGGDF